MERGVRAVRAPTPFDRDVVEQQNGIPLLTPDRTASARKSSPPSRRARASGNVPRLAVRLPAYYNLYDDLRSVELDVARLILTWGNGLKRA